MPSQVRQAPWLLKASSSADGTGLVRTVDRATLVPDESISIDDGAVAPWNSLMWSLMTDVCRAMGVRTNVPFRELTDRERDIVFNGPAEKKHIFYKAKSTPEAGELDFTMRSTRWRTPWPRSRTRRA